MNEKEILQLDHEIAELNHTIMQKQAVVSCVSEELVNYRSYVSILEKKRELAVEEKPVVVSDHALIRYMERVHNVDFQPAKDEIVTDKLQDTVNKNNGTCRVSHDGFDFVVNDYKVVTIVPK